MEVTKSVTTTENDETVTPEYEYAFYFPEGTGYLFVEPLGRGADGQVDVVWSCAEAALAYNARDAQSGNDLDNVNLDKVHFVRKKTHAHLQDRQTLDLRWPNPAEEVRHYRTHERIPKLIDWVEYHPLNREHKDYHQFTSSSMIFQLCNGGTLGNVIEAYYRLNQIRQQTYMPDGSPAPTLYIPESFIFLVFGQLLEVVGWLHHQQPSIDHADIHLGNVFIHFSKPGQLLPDCFLGDFGRSTTFDPQQRASDGRLPPRVFVSTVSDYQDIRDVLVELITLSPAASVIGGSPAVRDAYTQMSAGLVGYSDLLYNQIRRFEDILEDASDESVNPDFSDFAQKLIDYGQALNGLRPYTLRGIAPRHPGGPKAFPTRAELLQSQGRDVPAGPWKVARIRTDNKAVVALSREVYRTYHPRDSAVNDDYFFDRRDGDSHSIPASSRDMSTARL